MKDEAFSPVAPAKTRWSRLVRPAPTAALLLLAIIALTGCIRVVVSNDSSTALNAVAHTNLTGAILPAVALFEVENRMGNVRIIGADDAAPAWSWQLTARAETDLLAQEAAAAASCKVDQDGDHFRLIVSFPKQMNRVSLESELQIRLPKGASVRCRNAFGEIRISDLKGSVDATGQNGAVEIQNVTGEIVAQTSFASLKVLHTGPASLENRNGSIEASHIQGPLNATTSFARIAAADIGGPVKIRNRNGSITLERVGGPADAETSFAEMTVESIEGEATLQNRNGRIRATKVSGAVEATTSFASIDISGAGPGFICRSRNGEIRLRVSSSSFTSIQATTSFAPIELHLPAGVTPAIQAHTRFAEINSDFPVIMKPHGEDGLAGVPPGTPRVLAETQNGAIRIVRD